MSASTSNTDNLDRLLSEFREAVNHKKNDAATKLLKQLKLGLATLPLLPPFSGSDVSATRHHLLLARETYELAVLHCINTNDVNSDAVARLIVQLRPFYSDFAQLLPDSERKCPILGAYLLLLLAANRIGDFHNEIQLLSNGYYGKTATTTGTSNTSSGSSSSSNTDSSIISNLYIKYPIALEEELMFGSYKKILDAREARALPTPLFAPFINSLLNTVREKVADCSEGAYSSYPVGDLGPLLRIDDKKELDAFITKRGWRVDGTGRVHFPKDNNETKKLEIAALPTIRQTLHYATELERIV